MTEDEVPSVNPKLDTMCKMLKTIHDLDKRNKTLKVQLTKARGLLKWALHSDPKHDEDFD